MNSWEEFEKSMDDAVSNAENKVLKQYAIAWKRIKEQIGVIYEKYAKNGELTFAEMQKYDRYNNMMRQIVDILDEVITDPKQKIILDGYKEVFSENYYFTGFVIESAVDMKLGWGMLNHDIIQASINNPISGMKLNERLQRHRNDIISKLNQEMTQGFINGEAYDKVAKRFKGALENDAKKAQKIANTEMHRASQEGRYVGMERAYNAGADMVKVWLATLDSKTRRSHQKLDGQEVEMDKYFTINGHKAMHPMDFGVAEEDINCRCTVRPKIRGMKGKARIARNEDGKNEIIPYTTYSEWKANRIDKKG